MWLRPAPITQDLPVSVREGLQYLERVIVADVPLVVRGLVDFTAAEQTRPHYLPAALSVSVRNRRRRSARLWINAILQGRTDRATLHALTHTWIPQLAGTGPEAHLAVAMGRTCVEYLHGALSALIAAEPEENLFPVAKALHGLEGVLSVHLQAIREIAIGARV